MNLVSPRCGSATSLAAQMNLVEQQIATLNAAQNLNYNGDIITLTLMDPKRCYEYQVSDLALNLFLDSIILHQVTSDDWKCKVELDGELIFDTCISRDCFDKLKIVLDGAQSIGHAAGESMDEPYIREDARPIPRKEKERIPSYYQINSRDMNIPVFMYIGGSLEDWEEAQTNHKEFKYKKVKVKGCKPIDVPMAHLNI